MLRPEQMSKVSVTGAKSVMDEVIETMHDQNLVHITDYDGSWEGFQPGDSLEGADETSSMLVTVRAIESTLDISEDDAGSTATVSLDNAEEKLEEIRTEINELDDRRDELRGRQREIQEQLDQMELFADLGMDLDLLWGYDSLAVRVGEGDSTAIESALAESEDIDAYDVFSGTYSVAVFAQEQADGALEDAMVGVPFSAYDVPETTGNPTTNVQELKHEYEEVQTKLERTEAELEEMKVEHAGFLLALEEKLSIEAQKYEAPLRFATTERSFIVEGWVPTEKYVAFTEELDQQVGGRLEIKEIERARYTNSPHDGHHSEETEPQDADTGTEVATDGGTDSGVVTVKDNPPVIQQNPNIIGPFELLVKAVNRPKYSELDPTIAMFLTFPLFFGFMIGDVGYGLLYVTLGYGVVSKVESKGLVDFGKIVMWLGVFTMAFGVLYGEILGLHFFEWFGAHPPLEKGISDTMWAKAWLVVAVIAGWIHLNIGYIFNFVEEFQLHGAKAAVVEVGSWLLMLNGLWVFIFSTLFNGSKPSFLIGTNAALNGNPFGLGFTGFPEIAGMLGLLAFVAGLGILITGPWFEAFEFLAPLAHTLSYTRLTAVLLAKAGMALAVNLLYWGAYRDEEGFHYMYEYKPGYEPHGEEAELVFGGIANMGSEFALGPLSLGLEGAILGLPVLIVGHIVVLAVGGTAAIQAIRLEYFEFFEKFYEGGGKNYQPFGYDRSYTTDN
ncbi:V-type ATP synthase subunit I [Halovenus rubra]|uniref:A-type ATP synthase subunit I n=2 Tax=Halovenus rubra TaxID=869890 RepID=A0ABD5X4F1_9EURY|nr:V-type ATP synthase subunit I [Halovenus rubra]